MRPLFITGIGTDIGKTVVAAILTEALDARYWKPVQAGYEHGTDSQWVEARISRPVGRIMPEVYKLEMPASPHIAARSEAIRIDLDHMVSRFRQFPPPAATAAADGPVSDHIVIEGAGGLFVPLNDREFVIDLATRLEAPVILVSRNYLGSINHSLMTAALCKAHKIPVAGWIFNDQYLHYEEEIVQWTGIPAIASIPFHADPDAAFIAAQAKGLRASLLQHLQPFGVSLNNL